MANQIELRTRSTSLGFPYRQRRSLMGNATTALLQPVTFYHTLPVARHWLWAALFILVMVGWSAVRQEALREAENGSSAGTTFEVSVPETTSPDVGLGGGIMIPGALPSSLPPGSVPPPTTGGGTPAANISDTLMTALVAAGGVVLAWMIQAALLLLVSMLRGFAPSFGRNVQITVWASLPLGVMALLQLIYFAAGGSGGMMGLSLLIEQWPGYAALPIFTQAALLSLLTQVTLFWLWSLILLYMGARHALDGSPTAAALVVVFWLMIAVFAPVLAGTVTPPASAADPAFSVPLELAGPSGETTPTDAGSEMMLPDVGERGARADTVIPDVRPGG